MTRLPEPLARVARGLLGPVRWNRLKLALGRLDQNGFYDILTREILMRSLRSDAVCVDVGCHRGSILRMMMRCAPQGKFYAFEPLPELYRDLVATFPQDNVRIFPYALSDRQETSSFVHVVSNPGYSGFVERRYDRPHEETTVITVATARLDDLIEPGDRVAFMKIDVEGAELQVLRGAVHTITRDRPLVIFEHGPGGADCYGTRSEDVHDFLREHCGLAVSTLDGWLTGSRPLSRVQFRDYFHAGRGYYFVAHPTAR